MHHNASTFFPPISISLGIFTHIQMATTPVRVKLVVPGAQGSAMNSTVLHRLVDHLRARQYSKRTQQTYNYWARRYLRFHRGKEPETLDEGHR